MLKNRPYIYLLLLLLSSGPLFAQRDSLKSRIILIGDAGEQKNGVHPEIEMIKKNFLIDERTTFVYLGDNIYPQGLPPAGDANYSDKKQILDSQINIVQGTEANAYFIAGNHDWMQGGKNGYQQMLRQCEYITSLQKSNVHCVPSNALPGPAEIAISDKITLITMDSQWWLHKFDKPATGSENEILSRLGEMIARNKSKLVIYAAHHPFITFGPHGGYFTVRQHIFPLTDVVHWLYIPLPVIGSIYPLSRKIFGNIQDTKHPKYRKYIHSVDSILSLHNYCIRTAGHEHNLQFIQYNNSHYIVSGAGSKHSAFKKDRRLLFSSSKTGFATIDVIDNGQVYVKYYSSQNENPAEPFFTELLEGYSF